MLTPFNLLIGIGFGFSSGLLRLPDWYLDSSFGERWKNLAGTNSRTALITISLLLYAIGIGYSLLVFWVSTRTGNGI